MIEQTPLYKGEIVLEFNSGNHQYRVVTKGRKFKVPSVTSITGILDKPALIPWAVNSTLEVIKDALAPGQEYSEVYLEEVLKAAKDASQNIKREAAGRGTSIHKEVERSLRSDEGYVTDNPGASAILSFLGHSSITPECVERKVYSRRHRYSGTLDCIGRDRDGGLVLLDWKTGKDVYPEFLLQTAAYVIAYEEETGDEIKRRIICVVKENEVIPHEYGRETLRGDFAAFLGAKRLYEQLSKIKKRK